MRFDLLWLDPFSPLSRHISNSANLQGRSRSMRKGWDRSDWGWSGNSSASADRKSSTTYPSRWTRRSRSAARCRSWHPAMTGNSGTGACRYRTFRHSPSVHKDRNRTTPTSPSPTALCSLISLALSDEHRIPPRVQPGRTRCHPSWNSGAACVISCRRMRD